MGFEGEENKAGNGTCKQQGPKPLKMGLKWDPRVNVNLFNASG